MSNWEDPGWKRARQGYHAERLVSEGLTSAAIRPLRSNGHDRAPTRDAPLNSLNNREGLTFPPLAWLDMSTWDSDPIPERKWAIKDRVPLNQAGLFSGEGGAGKSIIELMKDVAHVSGRDWLGSLPEVGPAFYIGAEDDQAELHIRLAAIAAHYQTTSAKTQRFVRPIPEPARSRRRRFISRFIRRLATSSRRISRSTRCPERSPATRLTVARSMALQCICKP
jgi:hypothetical protein